MVNLLEGLLNSSVILGALAIFTIRVISIAISTIRILFMGRAHPLIIMTLATIEALAFALTFAQVAANLGNILNLTAYCLGFATGTYVGTVIDARVGAGFSSITIISMSKSSEIAEAVRNSGHGATRIMAEGTSGEVGLVRVIIRRRMSPKIISIVNKIDPKAFITIESAWDVKQGFLSGGQS
jgi:uncharacterized protein YebE (UPF0316 family)